MSGFGTWSSTPNSNTPSATNRMAYEDYWGQLNLSQNWEAGGPSTYHGAHVAEDLSSESEGEDDDDELEEDEEEVEEEDHQGQDLAEAIQAARVERANPANNITLGALGCANTSEESGPSSSAHAPLDAAITQNRSEASGHTFGSNETVYNPYSPLTSNEYMQQEVAAGRMKRKDIKKKEVDKPVETLSITGSGTVGEVSGAVVPARVLQNARSSLARVATGQHHALTYLSNHLSSSASLHLGPRRRVAPQAQPRNLSPQQPPRCLELPDEGSMFAHPAEAYSTPSQIQARLETMMRQEMSFDQGATLPNPGTSSVSPFEALYAPVAADEPSPPSLPARRTQRRITAASPRRRAANLPRTRSTWGLSAAPSAAAQTCISEDDCANDNSPVLARKRRRADQSPEEIPLAPPSSTVRRNRSGRLSARPASIDSSASSVHSRGRAASNAEASTSADQPPQGQRTRDLSLQIQFDALPLAIQHKIMSYVFDFGSDIDPAPRKTRLFPDMDDLFADTFVFTSELFPRKFNVEERQALLNIFRTKTPYVPAAISLDSDLPPIQWHITNGSFLYKHHLGSAGQGWPAERLPTEVFDNIVSNLARDDIREMRLVNHEFEAKVSNRLFRRVVVPFRPEIYGLIVKKDKPVEINDVKGKGKAKKLPIEDDTTGKDVHDGMKVFQAWGPHINQFAMAFELDEGQLASPPRKEEFEYFVTFWGPMKWPHPYYNRFEICAQLEKKADEYRCMSIALSNLEKVRDLGLSIDSGLGWLVGPDISDRAEIFSHKPQVFGEQLIPDSKHEAHKLTWSNIVNSLHDTVSYGAIPSRTMVAPGGRILTRNMHGFYEIHLYHPYARGCEALTGWEKKYFDSMSSMRLQFMGMPGYTHQSVTSHPLVFQGVQTMDTSALDVLATAAVNARDNTSGHRTNIACSYARLKPNDLATSQKELLLETEWAQRAFLSSYCMSLTDNTETFQHVQTLTIAKLSSRYLGSLQRADFWRALPQLNALVFFVSPDFRDIQKTDTGVVDAVDLNPSEAAATFYTLLLKCVAKNWSIKTMTLGYSGGGEQQTGIFGRNKHILPAPLTDCGPRMGQGANGAITRVNHVVKQDPEDILALPHVEHLTLTNCWIAPSTLKDFVAKLRAPKMQTLTLDSVSLTAHSDLVMNFNETDPMDRPGFFRLPDGPPRLFDPMVGNLHQQRGNAPHPNSTGQGCWNVNGGRIGSWRNVIDSITPGPTIDLLRWVYQHTSDFPTARQVGALQRVNFNSCGYVRLNNAHGQNFDQSVLDNTVNSPPAYLQPRALSLMSIMMNREHDKLLGQIVPSIPAEEQEVFRSAFPMTLGWVDREAAAHVLEDGQPLGGTGRFSGHVEKLRFPEHGSF